MTFVPVVLIVRDVVLIGVEPMTASPAVTAECTKRAKQVEERVAAYLQHALGLIKQLPGFGPHILVFEDLGIASVGVPPTQLPCLQGTVQVYILSMLL